jgi:hypothetical protein
VTFRLLAAACLATAGLSISGCVTAQPPTDTGDAGSPTAPSTTPNPTSPTTTALAYVQDMAPIFSSDCTVCHSGSRPSAGYSMTSYAAVMRDVTPGSASSPLVTTTQPNGSMYRYFTGNRSSKADMVKRWVVDNNAAQTR